MNTVRKIDWYGQLFFGILMILSIFILFLYGFGFGLLILGAWQLISALANTFGFTKSGLKKEIRNYWIFTVTDLLIFFSPFFLKNIFDEDDLEVLIWTGATLGMPIAIYYLRIYKKLIMYVDLSNELTGFTKHNNI